jgi:hypothetical protein
MILVSLTLDGVTQRLKVRGAIVRQLSVQTVDGNFQKLILGLSR